MSGSPTHTSLIVAALLLFPQSATAAAEEADL